MSLQPSGEASVNRELAEDFSLIVEHNDKSNKDFRT